LRKRRKLRLVTKLFSEHCLCMNCVSGARAASATLYHQERASRHFRVITPKEVSHAGLEPR
jgi:hypothetical protein